MRYFLCATVGVAPNGGISIQSFIMKSQGEFAPYPSKKEIEEHSDKHFPNLRRVHVISVSEMSEADCIDFERE